MTIDPQTVAAARAGDAAALAQVLQTAWPVAYRTAFAIVRDAQAAEDAAQDACATMCVKLTKLRDVSAFGAWFGRIAATAALRAVRGRARFVSLDTAVADGPNAAADRTSLCDDVTERIVLSQAIEALPNALRVPLVLHYVQGLRGEEIARVLRVAHGTVRYRLSVARRLLLERLQPQAAVTAIRFDRAAAGLPNTREELAR